MKKCFSYIFPCIWFIQIFHLSEHSFSFACLNRFGYARMHCSISASLQHNVILWTSAYDAWHPGYSQAVLAYKLEKWFPLQGERAHFLYFWSFPSKNNREEGRQNNRPINLSKVITFSKVQVHHLTLFIIHNKHKIMNTIFIHIYLHTYMICSSQLY